MIIDWFSYHTLWLGFSGGLDSSVLLHQLTQIPSLKPKIKLIHVHHGLSPNADAWALHAQKIADAYDIPIFIERVALDSPGNIESKARQLRYSQFKKHVKQGDALLLAHHEDDQAETLLLNLMRGTGIDGLSGMRACRSFHEGTLLRPLLQISRQSLEEYALEHSIRYIHDESNFDTSYRRNFIRHEIIPKLREVWPHACKKIAETANICQDSSDNLFELGLLDGTNSDMSLSYRRQLNAIRTWLKQQEILMPSQAVLDEIYQLLCSKQDSEGVVKFSHYAVYRYKNKLYLEKSQLPYISDRVWQDIQTPFCIPEMGITLPIPNLNLKTSKKIEIRFRKGGELFHFRGHKHRLKKLMQEEFYIPPWRRHLIPLLYIDNVFAALYVITASNEAVGWTYSSLF